MTDAIVHTRPGRDGDVLIEVVGELDDADIPLRAALVDALVHRRPSRILVDLSRGGDVEDDDGSLGAVIAACDTAADFGIQMQVRGRDGAHVRQLHAHGVPLECLVSGEPRG
jgi:hypothetical protein